MRTCGGSTSSASYAVSGEARPRVRAAATPPGPDVVSAPAQVVTLLNPSGAAVALEYLSHEGELLPSLRTGAAKRSFRPLRGSVWRILDRDGDCIQQFVASRDGVVLIRERISEEVMSLVKASSVLSRA